MSHRHATIEDERDENNMSHCRKLFEAWKVISNERVVIPRSEFTRTSVETPAGTVMDLTWQVPAQNHARYLIRRLS
jgi:hypothetical protein